MNHTHRSIQSDTTVMKKAAAAVKTMRLCELRT